MDAVNAGINTIPPSTLVREVRYTPSSSTDSSMPLNRLEGSFAFTRGISGDPFVTLSSTFSTSHDNTVLHYNGDGRVLFSDTREPEAARRKYRTLAMAADFELNPPQIKAAALTMQALFILEYPELVDQEPRPLAIKFLKDAVQLSPETVQCVESELRARNISNSEIGLESKRGNQAFWRLNPNMRQTSPEIVIFGATGDLAKRKLLIELGEIAQIQNNQGEKLLGADTKIILTGRKEMSTAEYKASVLEFFDKHPEIAKVKKSAPDYPIKMSEERDKLAALLERVEFITFDPLKPETHVNLKKAFEQKSTDPNRFLYFSLPPESYASYWDAIKEAGLINENTKVVVEKPFGKDQKSAIELASAFGSAINDGRVLLIDHYTGKEAAALLLNLQQNPEVSKYLNGIHVSHIELNVTEPMGVEGRGYYDREGGATRDMLVNHMLQLIALGTMDLNPTNLSDPVKFMDAKYALLMSMENIPATRAVRAQYSAGTFTDGKSTPGYLTEVENASSNTETFIAAEIRIRNPRWSASDSRGVHIAAKHMKAGSAKHAQMVYHMKPSADPTCPEKIVLRVQPDPAIIIYARDGNTPQITRLDEDQRFKSLDAYGRLFTSLFAGNNGLFVGVKEVIECWMKVRDILPDTTNRDMLSYEPGSEGPTSRGTQADLRVLPLGAKWTPFDTQA